jgi:hypothetical protein
VKSTVCTDDGSVVDQSGKVLLYSIDRFTRDICDGDCCFICGVARSETTFNDEHVLPDWILRRFRLHSKQIGLPNRSGLTYASYKAPCCAACNSRMADVFENPISGLVAQGYKAVQDHILREGPLSLFQWLNLIFVKTHLKDKTLRFHLDSRKGDETISDLYRWEELHHIHCVARAFFTGARLDISSLGTLLVLPARTDTLMGDFDYRDLYVGKTMLLRLGEVGIVAVLNDSCAALNVLENIVKKISGPLSPAQFRELMARAAEINLRLKDRPIFGSRFDKDYAHQILTADVPNKVTLVEQAPEAKLGEILHWCYEDIIPLVSDGERDLVATHIKEGKYSLLLDQDGNFIRNPPI